MIKGSPGRRFRHLFRFIALATIVGLIHKSHQEFLSKLNDKGQPIELSDVQKVLPQAAALNSEDDNPAVVHAYDEQEKRIGLITQTSPQGDSAIGFSGSTNLMVIWDEEDQVSSVSIRTSGDTVDHVDAILEKPDFFKQFEGKTREDLAELGNIEAVSGATLTSMAIVDAIALRFGV